MYISIPPQKISEGYSKSSADFVNYLEKENEERSPENTAFNKKIIHLRNEIRMMDKEEIPESIPKLEKEILKQQAAIPHKVNGISNSGRDEKRRAANPGPYYC